MLRLMILVAVLAVPAFGQEEPITRSTHNPAFSTSWDEAGLAHLYAVADNVEFCRRAVLHCAPADLLAKLKRNQRVDVLPTDAPGWSRVRHKGKVGYVRRAYVSAEKVQKPRKPRKPGEMTWGEAIHAGLVGGLQSWAWQAERDRREAEAYNAASLAAWNAAVYARATGAQSVVVVVPAPAPASPPPASMFVYGGSAPSGGRLLLYGGPGARTYLGCVSCSIADPDSVENPNGRHGWRNPNSVWNRYSQYGSTNSATGACNAQASEPPVIVSGGMVVGRFTLNGQHPQLGQGRQYGRVVAAACR